MVTRTSQILGADGQPIRIADLAEPQTSRVGQLHQELQGHPSRGLTPSRQAQIMLAAEQGDVIAQYELYEDMEERDGHIFAEMGKRRRAVSGLNWEIVPPTNPTPEEEKAAETLQLLVSEIEDLDSVLFDTTDAIGKGFACQEIEWFRIDGRWLPKSIVHRPQSWFRLYRGYQQEVRLRDHSADGAPLQPFGWVTHTHRARSGYLERASLFRALVWPYLFKNYSVGDLAEFLEIYGIPLRVGKYPPGASDTEKLTLLRALVSIGHNAAGIIPDGMSLEFEKTADGDAAAFQLMMDWCERTESKVILGATLTSQADRGSNTNALGNVHNEVRKELKDSDAKQVGGTISRDLVYPIAALNGLAPNGYRRCPRFRLDIAENKDLMVMARALPRLVKMGMRVPLKWAHEEMGIPKADDGEDILVDLTPAVPGPGGEPGAEPAAEALARAAAKAQQPARDRELAGIVADRLGADAHVHVEGWLDHLQAAVEESRDLGAFRARLDSEFTDLPTEQLSSLVAQALLTAELGGRASVQDEVDAERNA
jgi:phage gp29-like protein